MVLNRLTCPECSAGIESSAGYTPGQVVRCPKCETEFTVEDGGGSGAGSPMQPAPRRAGESDDFQPSARRASADAAWTYKNSWVRYRGPRRSPGGPRRPWLHALSEAHERRKGDGGRQWRRGVGQAS